MRTGIDYAWAQDGQPSDAALHAAGVTFVCRYLSSDASKRIGAAEASRHLAAGRDIVLVYEDASQAMLRGAAGGAANAQAAAAQASVAGLTGAPVYFAADWDTTPAQQAAINAYLDGAASVIGKARTGIYGGYWPVSRARAAGKAAYCWGTPAWSGSNWGSCGWKPHLMQGSTTTIGGVSCDWDTANAADFGQFKPPAPASAGPAFPYPAADYLAVTSADPHCHSGFDAADRPHIAEWQVQMAHRGWSVSASGRFDAASDTACRLFQGEKRLGVDGRVGIQTWTAAWTAPVT